MTTYYVDYTNGSDGNDGLSWGTAFATVYKANSVSIDGDVVKVAKSPTPVSIGDALWTDASKVVELSTSQNATVDQCESGFTPLIGVISSCSSVVSGENYAVDDIVTLEGGNNATAKVLTLSSLTDGINVLTTTPVYGGYGYSIDDPVYIVSDSGNLGACKVTGIISVDGIINTTNIINGGSGYTASNVLSIDGGTDGTVTVESVGDVIDFISVLNPTPIDGGSGYSVGDVISINGGSGATCRVVAESGGSVTEVELVNPGSGYTTGSQSTVEIPAGGYYTASGFGSTLGVNQNYQYSGPTDYVGMSDSNFHLTLFGSDTVFLNGFYYYYISGQGWVPLGGPWVGNGSWGPEPMGTVTDNRVPAHTGLIVEVTTIDSATGVVSSVSVLAGGTGYTSGTKTTTGGDGAGCTISIGVVDLTGIVTDIELLHVGSGFSTGTHNTAMGAKGYNLTGFGESNVNQFYAYVSYQNYVGVTNSDYKLYYEPNWGRTLITQISTGNVQYYGNGGWAPPESDYWYNYYGAWPAGTASYIFPPRAGSMTVDVASVKNYSNSIETVSLQNGGNSYSTKLVGVTGGSGSLGVIDINSIINSSTITYPSGKEGTSSVQLSYTTDVLPNSLLAYKTITELDLSSYQRLSFWFWASNSTNESVSYKVCLCSDTEGVTIVDEFYIPEITVNTPTWAPLTLTKEGGGDLGSSIQSIAIYTSTQQKTITVKFDNFIACTTNGLSLQSLISKEATGSTWHAIQSIDETTLLLDNDLSAVSTIGQGYSGVTETHDTLMCDPFHSDGVDFSGIEGVTYSGGYDTGTDLQTGITMFQPTYRVSGGLFGAACLNTARVKVNGFLLSRYNQGLFIGDTFFDLRNCEFTNIYTNNNITNVALNQVAGSVFDLVSANNGNDTGIEMNACYGNKLSCKYANNNFNVGIVLIDSKHNNLPIFTELSNNSLYGFFFTNSPRNTIGLISEAKDELYGIYFSDDYSTGNSILSMSGVFGACCVSTHGGKNYARIISSPSSYINWTYEAFTDPRMNLVLPDGSSKIQSNAGYIVSQASTLTHGSGTEWKLTTESQPYRTIYDPLTLCVERIAVVADETLNVKIWMKKGNATDIGARLVIRGGQITGIPDDVYTEATDTTDEQRVELSVLPTESGVIEVEVWAYYINNYSDVIVDSITTTQTGGF